MALRCRRNVDSSIVSFRLYMHTSVYTFYLMCCQLGGSSQGIVKNCDLGYLKDVRANCFCASLLRTQIHMPRHASSARAKY